MSARGRRSSSTGGNRRDDPPQAVATAFPDDRGGVRVATGARVVPAKGVVMTTKLVRGVRGLVRRVRVLGEEGMTTAEYAVGTIAAVAFAALLLAIVRSGPVKSALTQVIVSALGTGS